MDEKLRNDLLVALNVLGLDEKSSVEHILSRTKKLKSIYEDSNTSIDMAKLVEIFTSSKILLEYFDDLKLLSTNTSEKKDFITEIVEEKSSYESKEIEKNENEVTQTIDENSLRNLTSKKNRLYLFVGSAIMFIVLAISIPITIIRYQENKEREEQEAILATEQANLSKYLMLESLMMEVSYSNIDSIGTRINSIPYDYRNINSIKTQYQMILKEINIIRNGNMHNDYEKMRIAYYNLVLIDNTTFSWDLSTFLDSVDKQILIYNIRWENSSYSFRYYFNPEDDGMWLSTNLPNNKESGKVYYYYTESNYSIFGYRNQNDSNDKFQAFRILSIKEDEIRIYCYSNQQTYILTPQNL